MFYHVDCDGKVYVFAGGPTSAPYVAVCEECGPIGMEEVYVWEEAQ